jgi:hypothetical protein
MYCLSDEQIEHILNDIRRRGIEMEDLQLNLHDHICCIIEQNLGENENFEAFYAATIKTFYKKELREIEEETKFLLTFKNYYTMKKVMITSGILSAAGFITGSIFKFMHWPGANILIVLAIVTIGFVFLPLMCILKSRETNTRRDKLIIASGTFVGVLYCISVLFTIMHWPGARTGVFWIITTAASMLVFIPAYFFTGIRKPETKVNTIIATVLLVVATGLHFTLVNLRPTNPEIKMYSYIQNERLLEKMQHTSDGAFKANSGKNKLVADIQNTCQQIKGLILRNDIGQTSLPENFETKNIIINERNLGDDFFNDGAGITLLSDLKTSVIKYNLSKENDQANLIPVNHSILAIEPARISGYTNLFILNGITQLQMYLANAENAMIAANKNQVE